MLFFQTRNIHLSSQNAAALHKTFKKFLEPSKKRKMRYLDESLMAPSTGLKFKDTSANSINIRRINMLNKMFMRNITDLMINGPNSLELSKLGISINRVKITNDYKFLNLFWVSNDVDSTPLDLILEKTAGQLRHELTQLNVMGSVPHINFVKDKQAFAAKELDKRLAIADFPPEESSEITEDELNLPTMTHDIFGLNHKEILTRLNVTKKPVENKTSNRISNDDISPQVKISEREAFKQFLLKRQLNKTKQIKEEEKYVPDFELIKEEMRLKNQNHFNNFPVDLDDLDFIDEENESKD